MTPDRPRILVIADDLTGAAELAAAGTVHGWHARIWRVGNAAADFGEANLLVVDTDSRSLSPEAAESRITQVLQSFAPADFALIYKKTDSLLRGNVAAEIAAVQKWSGHPRALLIAQNPAKGRIVRNGQYFVADALLHQTSFRNDPEHPRTSSNMADLLAPHPIAIVSPDDALPPTGLIVANTTSLLDVNHFADGLASDTLPAGGANFFQGLLKRWLPLTGHPARIQWKGPGPQLVIAGSASSYSREMVKTWKSEGHAVLPLPETVVNSPDEEALEQWLRDVPARLGAEGLIILAITHHLEPSRAIQFRTALAAAACHLLRQSEIAAHPLRLYVEGGATAAAITDLMAWDLFDIADLRNPGVVRLIPVRAPHVLVSIKPGSYPWPAGPIESW